LYKFWTVFKSLIYVGIKPNSTKSRADWLYASNVAIALFEQSHKTSAEQHCPCFTALPCHIKTD
jgi:hypothetical protein